MLVLTFQTAILGNRDKTLRHAGPFCRSRILQRAVALHSSFVSQVMTAPIGHSSLAGNHEYVYIKKKKCYVGRRRWACFYSANKHLWSIKFIAKLFWFYNLNKYEKNNLYDILIMYVKLGYQLMKFNSWILINDN